MINEGMVKDLNYSQAKERLVFLFRSNSYKGRFELLYELYKKEIHDLSLLGASRVISKELGYPIGIQTIRTLRKKSDQLKMKEALDGYRETSFVRVDPKATGEVSPVEISTPAVSVIQNYKPIDVFDKEFQKEPSLIQWAKL